MNITLFRPQQNINFGQRRLDDYLDDMSDPYEDEIIPEYEELGLEFQQTSSDPFRENELFDRKKGDRTDFYYKYYGDTEDVPFNDDIVLRKAPKEFRYANYEFDPRESLPANYYLGNLAKDIYTADNSYNNEHESFQIRIDEGFTKEQVSGIYHSALVNKTDTLKTLDYKLAETGFELLKSGKELQDVKKLMNESKIQYADGSNIFSKPLFDFLTIYPDSRNIVVQENSNSERLRSDIIEIYPDVTEVCPDSQDAINIITACESGTKNNKKVNKELLSTCLDSIKSGASVENTAKSIRHSTLETRDNGSVFSKELFNFLLKYPDDRSVVVNLTSEGEKLKTDVIETYDKFRKISKDKRDIAQMVTACQTGRYSDKVVDENLIKLIKKLVKNGSSITEATNMISDAKLRMRGGVYFDKQVFDFIQKHPHSKGFVIDRLVSTDSFNSDKASTYIMVENACTDEETVPEIIHSCELRDTYYNTYFNEDLLGLAMKLLEKDPDWSQQHEKIMTNVVRRPRNRNHYIDDKKFSMAAQMATSENYSLNSIYSAVVLNMKNVELLNNK